MTAEGIMKFHDILARLSKVYDDLAAIQDDLTPILEETRVQLASLSDDELQRGRGMHLENELGILTDLEDGIDVFSDLIVDILYRNLKR